MCLYVRLYDMLMDVHVEAMYTVYTCVIVQFGCISLPGCGKTTLLDLLTGRRNSGEQKVANSFCTTCFIASCIPT